ncbi:MAG TPA: DUF1345 domain-containing protein [Kofleriaceae bacterium]
MAKPTGLDRLAPRHFLLFFGLLVVGWSIGSLFLAQSQATLAGFDLAAAAFLVSCASTFRHAPADMRSLAERSDANRTVVLVISVVLTVVVFAAMVGELGLRGKLALSEKLLIVVSMALAWTFGNAVYTLHYAHLFYSRGPGGNDRGGLLFPETPEPLMSDFAYFAFTLGVAVQTSDVQVTSRHIRNVVIAHSVIGFFFNMGVLALGINVLGAG